MNESTQLKLSFVVLVLLSIAVVVMLGKLTALNCAMTAKALGY
jgi:hypothetical protein